jgi:hypothetical protein
MQPLDRSIGHMRQCSRQKFKMYTKLATYKNVVVDQCSRNLELQSHLPAVVYMSQTESLRLLQKVPPKLGKAYASV